MTEHYSDDDIFHVSDPNRDAGIQVQEDSSHKQAILISQQESAKSHIISTEATQNSLLHQTDYTATGDVQQSQPGMPVEHHRRPGYTVQDFSDRAAAVGLAYNDSARYSNFNCIEEIEKALEESRYSDHQVQSDHVQSGESTRPLASQAPPLSHSTVTAKINSSSPGAAGAILRGASSQQSHATGKKHSAAQPNNAVFQQETHAKYKSSILDSVQYGVKAGVQKVAYGAGSAARAAGAGAEQLIMQSSAQSDDVGEHGAIKSGQIGFQVGKYTTAATVATTKRTASTIGNIYHGFYRGSAQAAILSSMKVNAKTLGCGIKHAVLDSSKREIESFYGSDDLGVEAIRRPKNIVIGSTRTIKIAGTFVKNTTRVTRSAGAAVGRAARKVVTKLKQLPAFFTSKSTIAVALLIVILLLLMVVISSISSGVSSSVIASPTTTVDGKVDLSPYVEVIKSKRNHFESEIERLKTSPMYDNVYIDYYGVTDNTREMLSMMAVYCEQDLALSNNAVEQYLKRLFDYSNYYITRTRSYTCSGDYQDDGGNWICTGHTDLYLSVYTLSFDELSNAPRAKSLYADSENPDYWVSDKIEWCQNIYDMDWSDLYAGIDGLTYSGSLDTDLSGVIGDRTGADAVVAVAQHEYNLYHNSTGGDKYWSWYGFDSWVNWCACFVSWVSAHASDSGSAFPAFASCSAGISWFAEHGLWARAGDYTPQPGDLIFFDWDRDSAPDHVGFVEYVSGGKVHTIEGNTDSSSYPRGKIDKHSYSLFSTQIYGYAVPNYY